MVESESLAIENHHVKNNLNTNHLEEKLSLPKNCSPLVHQVAGHFYGKGKNKLGK